MGRQERRPLGRLQMPRDWPDARFPEMPLTWWEIAVAGLLVAFGYLSMIWGVIQMIRTAIGL